MYSKFAYDYVIVGAGIVGLTVAYELKNRNPNATIAIFEKEAEIGQHASGRNSGVVHCGIYYGSDTRKAKVCKEGALELLDFARAHNISYSQTGKVIVATSEEQLPTIEKLLQNAEHADIKARLLSRKELQKLEPRAAPGPAAIHCPDTAVIDSRGIIKQLVNILKMQGVDFYFHCPVSTAISDNKISTLQGVFEFAFLFNCAGAYADVLASKFGVKHNYALIPFKGIYWQVKNRNLVNASIYPVPDIKLPFLGVHFTKVVSGELYVGPTAIPALGRENYKNLHGIAFSELTKILFRLSIMYMQNKNNFRLLAHTELAKYSKKHFFQAAQRLVPSLQSDDLIPSPKSGIRPQLINSQTNTLEMDYIFITHKNSFHVLNAISPAFTSSFAFAKMIVTEAKII